MTWWEVIAVILGSDLVSGIVVAVVTLEISRRREHNPGRRVFEKPSSD